MALCTALKLIPTSSPMILWIVLFDFNSCPSYLYDFIFCKKAFWQFTCSWCPCFLQVDVSRQRLSGGGMYPKSFCELNCTLDGFFCNISWIYQHPKIPPGHLFVQQSYPALAFLTWLSFIFSRFKVLGVLVSFQFPFVFRNFLAGITALTVSKTSFPIFAEVTV
jgi:hypothetical protein